jgi:hypothetical protein
MPTVEGRNCFRIPEVTPFTLADRIEGQKDKSVLDQVTVGQLVIGR